MAGTSVHYTLKYLLLLNSRFLSYELRTGNMYNLSICRIELLGSCAYKLTEAPARTKYLVIVHMIQLRDLPYGSTHSVYERVGTYQFEVLVTCE